MISSRDASVEILKYVEPTSLQAGATRQAMRLGCKATVLECQARAVIHVRVDACCQLPLAFAYVQAVTEMRNLQPFLDELEDFQWKGVTDEPIDYKALQTLLCKAAPEFDRLRKVEQELSQNREVRSLRSDGLMFVM